jgi:hypothetical protein
MSGPFDKALLAWRARNRPSAEQPVEQAQRRLRAFSLGGKRFLEIDFDKRTVLIDHYMMRIIRAHRLDTVMPMEGESNAAYFVRVQTAVLDTGRAHELLGGFLLPDGKVERDWTPDMGKQTADHIAHCNTEADRELVLDLCTEAVFAFFVQGVARLNRSLTFLEATGSDEAAPRNVH